AERHTRSHTRSHTPGARAHRNAPCVHLIDFAAPRRHHTADIPATGRSVGAKPTRSRPMAEIFLTLPDGNKRGFPAGVTAAEVAASIAPSLAKAAISAQLNGKHWDLAWPIEADSTISINTLKD